MLNFFKPILALPLLLLVSCNSDDSVENNETILSVFSKEEAKGQQEIHDFFTDKICAIENETDPSECFFKFMDNLKEELPKTGSFPYFIDKKEQDTFFEELDPLLFSEIWNKEITTDEDGDYFEFEVNAKGKYAKYLEKLGHEDEMISDYYEALIRASALSATNQTTVLMFPEKFDVEDVRIRLIIAIHYLTVCYQS